MLKNSDEKVLALDTKIRAAELSEEDLAKLIQKADEILADKK